MASTNVEDAQQLLPQRLRPKQQEDGMTFEGTTVELIHKVGPDCGIARITVDGQPAPSAELDTYSPNVEWNHSSRIASGLATGRHIVGVRPSGKKHERSTNVYVQIVGFQSRVE